MECKACCLFLFAFLGAIMMRAFNLAVSYLANPKGFECPCGGELMAQVVISLVVVALTFVSLWKEVNADRHAETWMSYAKGFTQSAILELILDALQRHGS